MINKVQQNSPSFGAGYHVYFYTADGRRIVSDKNMKKCLHYMEAHLNGSKRVKQRNQDLVDTFMFGKKGSDGKYTGGDKDYYGWHIIRSVLDNTADKVQGFINIATGADAKKVEELYGKEIGRNKGLSLRRTGSTKSLETSVAVQKYIDNAPAYVESKAVYKNGERQAFGIAFEPVYYTKGKHKGEVKDFIYHHSGFFNESLVK